MSIHKLGLQVNDTFTKELPADPITTNQTRQVKGACFTYVNPTIPKNPQLIAANENVAHLIGIPKDLLISPKFLSIFSGQEVLDGSQPYAMCYGGHQFGNWAGQLGDGRAINLMEVVHENRRWQLQLKGAGMTPYSRTADGLAVLRSSIREYLMSEAMHHLGVPTTRALSLITSGDMVLRDMMYDGNAAYEKGAIVCRVAPTFIRFGNFQILAARQEHTLLKQLTDYTIRHFYPELGAPSKANYIAFFKSVMERTLTMIIHWQRVGFVHGVMNTDNMSILGLTIDYGPYGWMDHFDPDWTPNTTDFQNRRYRYAHQPYIAQWNLAQLANALYPLIEEQEPLVEILSLYKTQFDRLHFQMIRDKLGLALDHKNDESLINDLIKLLPLTEVDMTIFYRNLSSYSKDDSLSQLSPKESLRPIWDCFYNAEEIPEIILDKWSQWMRRYVERLQKEAASDMQRRSAMNQVNPKYVLRNYMAQMAIDKAELNDYNLLHELDQLLQKPYDEQPEYQHWFAKRPDWARNKIGCSALSCSS